MKKKYKVVKWLATLFTLLCLSVLLCVIYAFKIEPYRLTINEITLGNEKPQSSFTIVQFSDTHIKEDFTAENLSKIVDEVNLLSADIVIFTGDLYDNYSAYKDDEAVISELLRIEANIAKIAISGNRDYGGGAVRQYENIVTQGGFTLLKNESIILETNDNKHILITGIDDSLMGTPYMPATSYDDIDYSLFLSHEPDVIENYPIENYNLILSGHTHGGQIDIPFLPFINDFALNETALSSKYNSGLTELNIQNNPFLYINTGIGTTRISARFMVVPEITHFTINIA